MDTFTLTVLTGIELVLLLLALAVALVLIRHALESIARTMDKIAWGVRAIETETGALPVGLTNLNLGFSSISDGLKQAATHFVKSDANLKKVGARLGRHDA